MNAGPALLSAEDVRLRERESEAIHFELRAGDRVGVWGCQNSGVGQLLRVLARLDAPVSGRIRWNGIDVTRRPRWLINRTLREGIILIWENPYVLFAQDLPVRQIIDSGARLVDVGLPPISLDLRVASLSGLERVRLALGYAAQRSPRILLVDDVFHHLVPEVWEDVIAGFEGILGRDTALVVASRYASALRSMKTIYEFSGGHFVRHEFARDLGSR